MENVNYIKALEIISKVVGSDLSNYGYSITPALFASVAKRQNIKRKENPYDSASSEDERYKILEKHLVSLGSEDERVLIITDENIKRDKYDIVLKSNLNHYIFDFYPEDYHMNFFQDADIIFILTLSHNVIIFDHEFYTTQFSFR
jgi:hypothetical protein